MKTGKRILSVFLVALMLLTAAPLAGFVGLEVAPKAEALAASNNCGPNVYWDLNTFTETLTIRGTGPMTDYGPSIEHPELHYPPYITNRLKVKHLVIENGVTSIGNYTFVGFSSLESVSFSSSVSRIGAGAFQKCTSLTNIEIPDDVRFINPLTFIDCTSLESVVLPDGLTHIGNGAFKNCTSLESMEFPDSLTQIGDEAFQNTSLYNSEMNWLNGVLYLSNWLIQAQTSLPAVYSIRKGTKGIADKAFFNIQSLTSIEIPNGVKFIGDHVFQYCSLLTSVLIPNSVISIGDYAFSICINLDIEIPNSVTSIRDGAFSGCHQLTSVTIPKDLTRICHDTFDGCLCLMSVTIPYSVTIIEEGAFNRCRALKDVYYSGTKAQWVAIEIEETDNYDLLGATIHCTDGTITGGSTGGEQPEDGYWVVGRKFDKNIDYFVANCSSATYNPVLSNILSAFSKAAYSTDDLLSAYSSFGFDVGDNIDNLVFDYEMNISPWVCGYAMAFKQSEYNDDTICFVSVRGTDPDNLADWLGDIDCRDFDNEKHIGFSFPANRIYRNIQDQISSRGISGTIKYVLTGHSRGAAVANLLAVKLMEKGVSASDVFDYNYACPDVACKYIFPSYDNLFNLCNREDIVPFVPGVLASGIAAPGKSWGKFGRTYWFTKDDPTTYSPFKDHASSLYLEFFDQKLPPESWGTSFWDKVGDAKHTWEGWMSKILCPVDVIITDSENQKIASVIDGEANYYDSNFGDVVIFTDGEKKVIYIDGDKDFNVSLTGTDSGTMTYSVADFNLRTGYHETHPVKTFSNVVLEKGKRMYSPVGEALSTSDIALYVVGEQDGQDVFIYQIEPDGKETKLTPDDHTHTYTSTITTEPTCTKPGEMTYTCVDGDDTYTEPIPALGHVDKNNDGRCDACGTQMTGGDHCKYCGKVHTGPFAWLIKFFHNIFAAFKRK